MRIVLCPRSGVIWVDGRIVHGRGRDGGHLASGGGAQLPSHRVEAALVVSELGVDPLLPSILLM